MHSFSDCPSRFSFARELSLRHSSYKRILFVIISSRFARYFFAAFFSEESADPFLLIVSNVYFYGINRLSCPMTTAAMYAMPASLG